MVEKFQIKIKKIDIDRWTGIGPDNVEILVNVVDNNEKEEDITTYIWPRSISGLFWDLIKGDIKNSNWGLSYEVSYVWMDKEKIKIQFYEQKKIIFEITTNFLDFAKTMISFFDELINILDERSIKEGYTEYKNDSNRELTLKYRSNIIEKVEEWKKHNMDRSEQTG